MLSNNEILDNYRERVINIKRDHEQEIKKAREEERERMSNIGHEFKHYKSGMKCIKCGEFFTDNESSLATRFNNCFVAIDEKLSSSDKEVSE